MKVAAVAEELYTAQDVADAAAAATPSVVLDGVKVAEELFDQRLILMLCGYAQDAALYLPAFLKHKAWLGQQKQHCRCHSC